MPVSRIAIGSAGEASHPDALKAALAEFISTLIFVFAGEGSGMAFSKILHLNFHFSIDNSNQIQSLFANWTLANVLLSVIRPLLIILFACR